MKYFIAHAGEDHSAAETSHTSTNQTNTLIPIIAVTLICVALLAAVAFVLSARKTKQKSRITKEDATE